MKRILSLIILLMLVCTGCGQKQQVPVANDLNAIIKRDVIKVGVRTDTYPFGFLDKKGSHTGYDPALARLIAKGILGSEKKVKFVKVTAADRMMKLYSGDVDMIIATMSVTPKRREILDFSNSYYTAGQALLVKKGSKIRKLQDLNKKRAIIVFGSTGEASIRSAVPSIGLIGYKTYPEAVRALKSGKADAIVSDDTILLGIALNDSSLELLPKKYSREPYAVAFRKGPESDDVINAVNYVIENATRNGTLKQIQKTFGIN